MRLRSPFWCHHSKKPVQGFEQGLNKVSSFQAVPTQDPPTHAYLCHFQSAFCPTLPTPPMPDASTWGQILCSKALLLVLLQGICFRRGSNSGHKHGRLVCCRCAQAKKQGSGCWRLPHCPFFFLSPKQHSLAAKHPTVRGFRAPAGRAQWISGPSPGPRTPVMLVPASHIHQKVYGIRPIGPIAKVRQANTYA